MRCGCKSRGNANLYLCVQYGERQFPFFTFLLLAFHIAYCCLLSSAHPQRTMLHEYAEMHKTKHRTIFSIWLVVLLLFLLFKLNSGAFLQAEKQFFRLTEVENRQMRERKKHTHIYIYNKRTARKQAAERKKHAFLRPTKKIVSANNLNMKIYRQIVLFEEHFDKSKVEKKRAEIKVRQIFFSSLSSNWKKSFALIMPKVYMLFIHKFISNDFCFICFSNIDCMRMRYMCVCVCVVLFFQWIQQCKRFDLKFS